MPDPGRISDSHYANTRRELMKLARELNDLGYVPLSLCLL